MWQTQGIHYSQDNISNHIPWQQHKIIYLFRGKIHGIYCYIEMIGAPNNLTYSGHNYNRFCTLSSTKNYTESIQPVIAYLRVWQKTILKFCGKIDTSLIPESYVSTTYSHQVLGERWTNSTTFMAMKQLIHQERGTANLHQFTSNTRSLLPKLALWFWLSWGDLFIVPLIMVMLRFNLKIIHLNLPLTLL